MDIIFYFGALLIVAVPFNYKGLHHLDIMPLFLLYFDATHVFIKYAPQYQYFEYTLILLISLYYFFGQNAGRRVRDFWVFPFLFLVMIAFPLLQGVSLDPALRDFSYTYAAMILLPLGFSYYSRTGNLNKLLNSTFLMVVLYVLFVFFATPLRLGGFQSERVAGSTFYYGNIAIRGGITYIGFVLLMVPLVLASLRKHWQKVMLIAAVGFIFIFLMFALKRFVFVVIGLGLLNYMLRPGLKARTKLRIGLFFTALAVFYLFDVGIQRSVQMRYEQRGGERKFSESVIVNDLRIYEPMYVLEAVLKKPVDTILIGENTRAFYDITHEDVLTKQRRVHNTYAGLISKGGLIGLALYLLVYYSLYRFVGKIFRALKKRSKQFLPYWIAFQNMVLIFVIQGMVGGHSHVTLRGLVFLYAGALGGFLFYSYKNLNNAEKKP